MNKFRKEKQLVQRKMRQAYWNYIEDAISIGLNIIQNKTTGQTRNNSGLTLNTERNITNLYQDLNSKAAFSQI